MRASFRKSLFFSAVLWTASPVLAADAVLQNGLVRFTFSEKNGALTEVRNLKTHRAVRIPHSPGLWRAELLSAKGEDLSYTPDTVPAFADSAVSGGKRLAISWQGKLPSGETYNACAEITLPENSAVAAWQFRIEINGSPASWIKRLDYPLLEGIKTLGDDYLVYGYQLGRLIRNPGKGFVTVERNAPGDLGMQFAAFYGSAAVPPTLSRVPNGTVDGFLRGPMADETGLFYAADDPSTFQKTLKITAEPKKNTISMTFRHWPAFPFWPQNSAPLPSKFSYTMPYAVKLGTFSGGVGAAAQCYREMVKERPELKQGAIYSAGNMLSPKVRNCVFWGKSYWGANKVVPELLRMRDYLRVPVNIHWVRYNANAFDDNNLNYFPSIAGYREGIRSLREAGIGVAPYLCCALWDPDTETYRRYGVQMAVVKDRTGSPLIWVVAGQPSYWMHPASPLWQMLYSKISMKMFGQFGTDGQYLDVLAIGGNPGYNPELNAVHGGNYWASGNLQLLNLLWNNIRSVEPDAFLTSEGFSEYCIGKIDAFLMLDRTRQWASLRRSEPFPLHSLIYHDYSVTYGSDCEQQLKPEMFRWEMGTNFLWGIQLCYAGCYVNPPQDGCIHDRFTKDLAQAWYQSGSKYLTGGRGVETALIAKPEEAGTAPVAVSSAVYDFKMSGGVFFPWRGPAVPGSSWLAHDGTLGITLVNISGKEQTAEVVLNPAVLPCQKKNLWRSWPLPVQKLGSIEKQQNWKLTIPADRSCILELRDDTPPAIRELVKYDTVACTADAQGAFPETYAPDEQFFGCADSWTLNAGGKLELCMDDGTPRKAKPYPWPKASGFGGPRGQEYRTFYLLQPSGCRFQHKVSAFVRNDGGIFAAKAVLSEKDQFLFPAKSIAVAVSSTGKIHTAENGSLPLPQGEYRIAVLPSESIPATGSDRFARGAWMALEQGRKLLSGPDSLSGERRRQGERQLAVSRAITFVFTGKLAGLQNVSDLLIVFREEPLKYNSSRSGKLVLLSNDHDKNVVIRPGNGVFGVTVKNVDAAATLLRFLFEDEITVDGVHYPLVSLNYLEAAEPLLAEIPSERETMTRTHCQQDVENEIRITNVTPVSLPVTVSAVVPDGWKLADAPEKLHFQLAPCTQKRLSLHFQSVRNKDDGKEKRFTISVNHCGDESAAQLENFTLLTRSADLIPAGKGAAEPVWRHSVRNGTLLALYAPEAQTFVVDVLPVHPTSKSLTWSLKDAAQKEIASRRVSCENRKEFQLQIPVPAKGLYLLQIDCRFFDVRPHALWYAYSAHSSAPYYFFCKRGNLFFHVRKGSRAIRFLASDDGPLEPGRIIVKDANGNKVWERFADFNGSDWISIPVPEGEDDKVWCLEIDPVQDMVVQLGEGSANWASPVSEAVLKEQ